MRHVIDNELDYKHWSRLAVSSSEEAAKVRGELARYDASLKEREGRTGDWHYTFLGRRFWPLDVRPSDIEIDDIVNPLSLINRFNGSSIVPYSVCQHSVHVAELVEPEYALYALLHDAAEAYVGDCVSPIKRQPFMDGYVLLEETIMKAIHKRFGVEDSIMAHVAVKAADLTMLATEVRDLTLYGFFHTLIAQGIKPLERTITPWLPCRARAEFMTMFNRLTRVQ